MPQASPSTNPKARRAQPLGTKPNKPAKKHKLPSVKNQIRSVQRLLSKDNIHAKTRANLEQRLRELERTSLEHKRVDREKTLARRYHKVRFFERKKLTRALRKLQASIQGQQPTAKQAQQLQQLQADLQYVLHFPSGEKYVSLLVQAATPEAKAVQEQERARLRALVVKQLAEKAVLTEANEGIGGAMAEIAAQESVPMSVQAPGGNEQDSTGDDVVDDQKHAAGAGQYTGTRGADTFHRPFESNGPAVCVPPVKGGPSSEQKQDKTILEDATFEDDFFLTDNAIQHTAAQPPPLELPNDVVQPVLQRSSKQQPQGTKVRGKHKSQRPAGTPDIARPPAAAAKTALVHKKIAKLEQPVRTRADGGRKRRKRKDI